jgi:hypothetical protein
VTFNFWETAIMLKIKKLIGAILAWTLIFPSFADDHQKHMAISIWGIKRGMSTAEAEGIIRASAEAKEISTSKYKGTEKIKNMSIIFTDGRSLRITFGTEDQKVADIYAHYQGASYKRDLQPTELKGLPKPEFTRDNSSDMIFGWGGRRLVDGELAPSSDSKGTLLVTHRKGECINISLEGLPN